MPRVLISAARLQTADREQERKAEVLMRSPLGRECFSRGPDGGNEKGGDVPRQSHAIHLQGPAHSVLVEEPDALNEPVLYDVRYNSFEGLIVDTRDALVVNDLVADDAAVQKVCAQPGQIEPVVSIEVGQLLLSGKYGRRARRAEYGDVVAIGCNESLEVTGVVSVQLTLNQDLGIRGARDLASTGT